MIQSAISLRYLYSKCLLMLLSRGKFIGFVSSYTIYSTMSFDDLKNECQNCLKQPYYDVTELIKINAERKQYGVSEKYSSINLSFWEIAGDASIYLHPDRLKLIDKPLRSKI